MPDPSLLDDLPEAERAAVRARLRREEFAADAVVVREGEPGDRWFFLDRGEAGVLVRDLVGQEVRLRVFGPGESFGETALLRPEPRTATVRALSPLTVSTLSRTDFDELRATCPAFDAAVRRHVDLLDLDRFLKKASVFARLPAATVWRVAGRLLPDRFGAGEIVLREGDPADRFYLVRSGRLEARRDGKRVGTLETGDCFGEVALLRGGTRTATIVALEPSELLSLDRDAFHEVVGEHASLRGQLAELTRIRYAAAPGQSVALPDPVTTLMPFLEERRRGRYWLLLAGGLGLFAVASLLALRTQLAPAMYVALVLGSFVVPVVYVVFLAESAILAQRPRTLAATFVLGAALGLPLAILVERQLPFDTHPLARGLAIGLIEELAKVLGVTWLLRRAAARFQMDGVVFGAAAGMGFAAFETILYGLGRAGAVGTFLVTLWLRTLLAPFGHGTWTALVCARLWGGKGSGAVRLGPGVIGAFATAVALHGLWDWQPLPGLLNIVWLVAIGAVGIVLLRAAVQRGAQEQMGAALALNPELAGAAAQAAELTCHRCSYPAPRGAHYCVRCGGALRAGSSGSA